MMVNINQHSNDLADLMIQESIPKSCCESHEWEDSYHGVECQKCGLFYPWDNDDCDDDCDDDDDFENALDECGMTSEGICMLAGTEHCDFECPFRDEW